MSNEIQKNYFICLSSPPGNLVFMNSSISGVKYIFQYFILDSAMYEWLREQAKYYSDYREVFEILKDKKIPIDVLLDEFTRASKLHHEAVTHGKDDLELTVWSTDWDGILDFFNDLDKDRTEVHKLDFITGEKLETQIDNFYNGIIDPWINEIRPPYMIEKVLIGDYIRIMIKQLNGLLNKQLT